MGKNIKVVGVDEVGRGPLAGPVSVGVVEASVESLEEVKRAIFFTDSKKMSAKKREEVFSFVEKNKTSMGIKYAVSSVSAKKVDSVGINPAIAEAIEKSLEKLRINKETSVFLDGGLKAPEQFINQETIKKGDSVCDIIALASVLAKVVRDRGMIKYDFEFPGYDFSSNKGYGTKKHIESIKKIGMCRIHRRSYIKFLTE